MGEVLCYETDGQDAKAKAIERKGRNSLHNASIQKYQSQMSSSVGDVLKQQSSTIATKGIRTYARRHAQSVDTSKVSSIRTQGYVRKLNKNLLKEILEPLLQSKRPERDQSQ